MSSLFGPRTPRFPVVTPHHRSSTSADASAEARALAEPGGVRIV